METKTKRRKQIESFKSKKENFQEYTINRQTMKQSNQKKVKSKIKKEGNKS